MSSINREKFLPPLRDGQRTPPAWLCALCGQEQYQRDRPTPRRGRLICSRCLERLREEEEEWI